VRSVAISCVAIGMWCVVFGLWSCRSVAPQRSVGNSYVSSPSDRGETESSTKVSSPHQKLPPSKNQRIHPATTQLVDYEEDRFVVQRRAVNVYWNSECLSEEHMQILSEHLKMFVGLLTHHMSEYRVAFVSCRPTEWLEKAFDGDVDLFARHIDVGDALQTMITDLLAGGMLADLFALSATVKRKESDKEWAPDPLNVVITTAGAYEPSYWASTVRYINQHFLPYQNFYYAGMYGGKDVDFADVHEAYKLMIERFDGRLFHIHNTKSAESSMVELMKDVRVRGVQNSFELSKDIQSITSVTMAQQPIALDHVRVQERTITIDGEALLPGEPLRVVYEVAQ